MKGLVVTLVIVLAALVVAGIFIFSGGSDNLYQQGTDSNQGAQGATGGANGAENPGNSTQTQPQTYSVEIKNFAFAPSTLNVKVGDTVTWTNMDSASHTVTSDSGGELASSSLSRGGTYSHTFTQAGTFEYHCSFHSGMSGKVIVE